MSKLYLEDIDIPSVKFQLTSPGANWTDSDSDILSWDSYGLTVQSYNEVYNKIKSLVESKTFASCTSDEKKVASKWFVVDKAERDTVKTEAEQEFDAEKLSIGLLSDSEASKVESLKNTIKNSDADVVYSETKTQSSPWKPPTFALGALTSSGTSVFSSIGAGHLDSFGPSQNDELLYNEELSYDGIPYDGSEISLGLSWQLFSSPILGNNVLWELDYAFLNDGDDNYTKIDGTVSMDIDAYSRDERKQYSDEFPPISGPSGSSHLQITLRRKGSGAGSDTYMGDADVYNLKLK